MSTLTFNARDMNRQPSKILAAAKRLGSVDILTRDGDAFSLTLKKPATKSRRAALPDFEARKRRLRELGCTPMPAKFEARFNAILRDEP